MKLRNLTRRDTLIGASALWISGAPPLSAQPITPLVRASDVPENAAFLALDLSTGSHWVLEGSDLESRRAPYSTFKIPNLVIALETGVETSLDSTRQWDRLRRPALRWWPDTWQRDHSLRTAFRDSVVWYFRDIALEVGSDQYDRYLSDWAYGNAVVPDGSDEFWLTGELRISVAEQVQFLAGLLEGNLGISDETRIALVDAARVEQRGDITLHGKTGGGFGYLGGGPEGWFVGFVRRPDAAPVVFALYLNGPTWISIRDARRAFAERFLQQAGFWPAT